MGPASAADADLGDDGAKNDIGENGKDTGATDDDAGGSPNGTNDIIDAGWISTTKVNEGISKTGGDASPEDDEDDKDTGGDDKDEDIDGDGGGSQKGDEGLGTTTAKYVTGCSV